MKNRIKPKSKKMVNEAVDIILNTDDDSSAVSFLQDTLEDDFPDLDLGKMDLHEAIGVLGGDEPEEKKKKTGFENINKALEMFMGKDSSNLKSSSRTSGHRKKKARRTRRKRK